MIDGIITSVASSYGHRFMGTDSPERDSCLTCGGMWELFLTPDAFSDADYRASNGDAPQHCTGNTSMVHGYPGERVCQDDNGRECEANRETGQCEHVDHDCNCLFCQ